MSSPFSSGGLRQTLRNFKQQNPWPLFWEKRLQKKILRTRPIYTTPQDADCDVELHLLCYHRDWMLAIWALKSFYYYSQVHYRLVIHLQSEIPEEGHSALAFHFPWARVVTKKEADEKCEPYLQSIGADRLLEARRKNGLFYKLVDVQLFANSPTLFCLDPDVLFFRGAEEIVAEAKNPVEKYWFQKDAFSGYCGVSVEEARESWDMKLCPSLNTGMVLRAKDSFSFAELDEYLAHPKLKNYSTHAEQTLQALYACKRDMAAYWPESYLVNMNSATPPGAVCRHYAGPSRGFLHQDGIKRLVQGGLLKELQRS